jgi:hypothetical protein
MFLDQRNPGTWNRRTWTVDLGRQWQGIHLH